jgi:hypothetical protein
LRPGFKSVIFGGASLSSDVAALARKRYERPTMKIARRQFAIGAAASASALPLVLLGVFAAAPPAPPPRQPPAIFPSVRTNQPPELSRQFVITQFVAGGPIILATQSATGSLVVITQFNANTRRSSRVAWHSVSGHTDRPFLYDKLLFQDIDHRYDLIDLRNQPKTDLKK